MILTELKKTYVILTGPLYSGKSTVKKELCKQLKTKSVDELQYGIDVSKDGWWQHVTRYADEHKTSVVEVHFSYDGKDHIDPDAKLGRIPTPPKNIQVYVVLPDAKELLKRQQTVDKFSTLKGAKQELKWYSDVAKQLDAKVLK